MHRAFFHSKWLYGIPVQEVATPNSPRNWKGPWALYCFGSYVETETCFQAWTVMPIICVVSKDVHCQIWIQTSLWSWAEDSSLFSQSYGSVFWEDRGQEGLRWGTLSRWAQLAFLKILRLCGLDLQPWSQPLDVDRKTTGHQPLCTCTHHQTWFSLAVYVTKSTNLCTQCLSVTLPQWHFHLVWFEYFLKWSSNSWLSNNILQIQILNCSYLLFVFCASKFHEMWLLSRLCIPTAIL